MNIYFEISKNFNINREPPYDYYVISTHRDLQTTTRGIKYKFYSSRSNRIWIEDGDITIVVDRAGNEIPLENSKEFLLIKLKSQVVEPPTRVWKRL